MNRKKDKQSPRKTDISGKWRVAELPDLADDYLDLSPDPHVMLELRGRGEIDGAYEFGAQSGTIDGRLERLTSGRSILCAHYTLLALPSATSLPDFLDSLLWVNTKISEIGRYRKG